MTEQPREQLLLDLIETEAPTLDNFVVGENAQAIAALRDCCAGRGPQFIYLWGPTGCGRSHLLRALTPTQRGWVPTFDETVDLYTVDNVQSLDDDELERLFYLMNDVRNHPNARLVVAGNQTPSELTIRDDVKSRLAWGLVYGLRYLDDAAARQEFIRLAHVRGIEISPEVLAWMSTHCSRDMRSLKQLLDRVDQFAMKNKRKVTLALMHRINAMARND